MDDTKKNAYTRVIATGSALPEKAVSNDSLAARLALKGVQTSDEWISSRTGIRSRYIAEPGLTVLELARRASLRALESGGIDPASIDLIIVATTTADCVFPS
ncbi:MAG TPA: 3-oxoacyl-ACP synthase, partial [Sutterella sp.]|nr:3-oxoacyl-ACP synthase [Sutterella sp.]